MSNIQQKGDVLPYGKERKVSYVKVSHIAAEGRDLPLHKSDLLYKRFFDIIFSSLAIFIACLGLIGLVAYTTYQKTKEIGIRKVLGAGLADIIRLISSQFFKPILVACIIAIPFSHFIINNYRQEMTFNYLTWKIIEFMGKKKIKLKDFKPDYI